MRHLLVANVLLIFTTLERVSGEDIEPWFALGCFWGTQHGLVGFEQDILGRNDSEITSVASYAGGLGSNGTLCYENTDNTDVYSSLGNAEAVTLLLASEFLTLAATSYFELFQRSAAGVWDRPDRYDLGAAYRSGIGIPGGIRGGYFSLVQAANIHNMDLVEGLGSDGDTFGLNAVLVYDSNDFPASQAELCLQFHDADSSNPYSPGYHALTEGLEARGRLYQTSCPQNYIC